MSCSCSGSADVLLPGPSRLLMLIDGPPLWPPWAFFSCSSRRSSWNTRELFSVPRASSIVCFWISVSVSWWRRFSSSVWLLLIVLFVSWKTQWVCKFPTIPHMICLHFNEKVTDLVPELLDFIFSVLDSALQSRFGSVMLFLQVLYLLWFKTNRKHSALIGVSGKQIHVFSTTATTPEHTTHYPSPACSAQPQPLLPVWLWSVRQVAPPTAAAVPAMILLLSWPDSPNPGQKHINFERNYSSQIWGGEDNFKYDSATPPFTS